MKKHVSFTLEIDNQSFDVFMDYLGRKRYICCGTDKADNIAWAFRRIMVEAARLAHGIDTRNEFLSPVFDGEALANQVVKVTEDAAVYLD